MEATHVGGGVERQRTQAETMPGGPLDSYRSWYIWSQIPKKQESFSSFLFFFCNSFYFVVVAIVVPEEVGVIQNTRVLPGTQQSSVPH